MEVNVGMRVISKRHANAPSGKVGTVLYINDDYSENILVEYDENVRGHSGGEGHGVPYGKDGHCWWEEPRYLEVVDDDPFSMYLRGYIDEEEYISLTETEG